MKLSTTFRTAALALALGATGAANAATLPAFGITASNQLTIDSAAHVTYKVESKNAGHTNVFLYWAGSYINLALGQSVTLYNVASGLLNFGFTTTAPKSADFYNTQVLNGNNHIKLSLVGPQMARMGFEDINMDNIGQTSDKDYNDLIVSASLSAVPLPGAALLFGTSMLAGAAARRKKQKQQTAGTAIAA